MSKNSFLKECAVSLFERYQYDISDINIVMPTRRAASFFKLEIASLITERPIWQPKFCSINSLMSKVSSLREAERIKLITELYKVYSRYHKESFDKFFYWGGVIISDFDTIDNYMVDAKTIYSNISDIKEIEERFDFLSDEQKTLILNFWGTFRGNNSNSSSQREFLRIWNTLYPIYCEYQEELTKQGIGYGGMIYRKAAEKLSDAEFIEGLTDQKYAVIGFNALSKCESILFDHLRDKSSAQFYWDYDNYYTKSSAQEAGMFIRKNIERYGDAAADFCRDNFIKDKNITIVDSPSETLACKYVGNVLKELNIAQGALSKESAVVLTNESLLIPLLYSVPESVENMNITSGYPLKSTAAYQLVNSLIKLHRSATFRRESLHFYHKELFRVIFNYYVHSKLSSNQREYFEKLQRISIDDMQPYIDIKELQIDDFTELLFTIPADIYALCDKIEAIFRDIATSLADTLPIEEMEYINRAMDVVVRLRNSIEGCEGIITLPVFYSLLDKYLSTSNVTFEGEPLLGMQIMGILESRNLDFKNVVLMSLSEDNYPSINALNSLIPSNLRLGYNLPTIANHEAMYSYYFYRLLQRAENVYLVYSSYSGESLSGEPSRYLHQLLLESPFKESIKRINLNLDIISPTREAIMIEKDEKICSSMAKFLDGSCLLSASRLYDYIECPLRFYFSTIERVDIPKEISEEVDAAQSGTILHKVLEEVYLKVKTTSKGDFRVGLKQFMLSEELDFYIDQAIREILNITDEEFSGAIIAKKLELKRSATAVINYDIESDFGFFMNDSEVNIAGKIAFDGKQVGFRGIVDRVDTLDDGTVRIIDYKSGKSKHKCKSLGSIMSVATGENSKPIFQTLLYSLLYKQKRGVNVRPSLYHARDIDKANYSELITIDKVKIESFSDVESEFSELLSTLLTDLFNNNIAFSQCDDKDTCKYCNFNSICWKE